MQVKEAQPSALEGTCPSSGYSNAAERVVIGQRLMQATGETCWGGRHTRSDGHEGDDYVRQPGRLEGFGGRGVDVHEGAR